jgi:hypothetical protein
MGIIVSVLRDAAGGDCSLNGVSSRFTDLCVVNVPGPFEPRPDRPAAMLLANHYGTAKVVPVDDAGNVRPGGMFGGNFVSSSDSRWGDAVAKIIGVRMTAVPVHDRYEW